MNGYLRDIIDKQNNDIPAGMVSVCTANGFAIKAAMKRALEYNVPVLIEATANQVDQNGGYTGMTPADFSSFVFGLARETDLPQENVIMGGDHLGPLTKCDLGENEAMDYAEKLVRAYAGAGFSKIHLDTSMRLASDPAEKPLEVSVVAERGARLCRAAEDAFSVYRKRHPESSFPLYVIGSEVPIPGGTQTAEETAEVTSPEHCRETYDTYGRIFRKHGLDEAFERVAALVVQTGVEFGDSEIFIYNPEAAGDLAEYRRRNLPVVFEGHSTDYQTAEALRAMVKDGIAFLKVGPALTFALREALFALDMIEKEIYSGGERPFPNFSETLEHAMVENPVYWRNHYHGNADELRFARKYSFSDRARYYLNVPEVNEAVFRLIDSMDRTEIPLSLLSQYLPDGFNLSMKIGRELKAEELIFEHIGTCLDNYYRAILPGGV